MGSDDLFRKNKNPRKSTDLTRKPNTRTRTLRYLIVCEGKKTEPYYLKEMLDASNISSQSVKIAPNDGNTPDRIVAHALKLYDEDAASGDKFDTVFCVFDRDKHDSYDNAVKRISDLRTAKNPKPFKAVTSTPCFEYWLLLHFGLTDQPFQAAGKKSICDNLITVLRKQNGFSQYGKGQQGIYTLLQDKLATAMEGAKRIRTTAMETGSINPLTNFDELIDAIQSLMPKQL